MAYKTLTELRNVYPEERNVQSSYSKENNSINYKGRYNENSLNFTIEDLSGISVVSGTTFNFILKIDGKEYTSPQFKSFLENSLSSGNPYIQKSNVTKVSFTKDELTNAETFRTREKYAEVEITENLDTIEELVIHIDWLVSKRQTLRDTTEYGEYNLYTTTYDVVTDSGIGLEYSDSVQSGTPYVASENVVTPQVEPKTESKTTLTTQQTTTTPDGGTYTTSVEIPIRYDISNPFTIYRPTIDFLQYRGSNLRF
jgi:hypothetical protein